MSRKKLRSRKTVGLHMSHVLRKGLRRGICNRMNMAQLSRTNIKRERGLVVSSRIVGVHLKIKKA
jgi:hypothetical protein